MFLILLQTIDAILSCYLRIHSYTTLNCFVYAHMHTRMYVCTMYIVHIGLYTSYLPHSWVAGKRVEFSVVCKYMKWWHVLLLFESLCVCVCVICDVTKAYNGCRWTRNLCHHKAKLHFVEKTLNRMINKKKQHWKNWRSKQTGLHSNSKLLFLHT